VTRNIGGHEVTISNPGKVLFPSRNTPKLDACQLYLAVATAAARRRRRPNMLVRFRMGSARRPSTKSAPPKRPSWIEGGYAALSVRPHGRRGRPTGCRCTRLARNLACLELPPIPCARRTSSTR